jgi:hypothetical protein
MFKLVLAFLLASLSCLAQLENQTNSTSSTTAPTTINNLTKEQHYSRIYQIVYDNGSHLEYILNWVLGLLIAMVIVFAICIIITTLYILASNCISK